MAAKPIDTEQILRDAEIAAMYFRMLVDKGVPVHVATQLTASYVTACRFADESSRPPRQPWEDPPI